MKKAVVDINTNAIETFDKAIASKKQYQCIAIKTPFPKSLNSVFLETIILSLFKIRYKSKVTQAISILQKTTSLEFNPLKNNNLPIMPVNPHIRIVKWRIK